MPCEPTIVRTSPAQRRDPAWVAPLSKRVEPKRLTGVSETKESHVKAIVQNDYGSEDALTLADIDTPIAGDDEVWCASCDVSTRRRLVPPERRALPRALRSGMAQAEELHTGSLGSRSGRGGRRDGERAEARATRCTGSAKVPAQSTHWGPRRPWCPKPASLTFEQAAAIPTSALAALHELRDAAKVQPGQRVLINGASGGVGIYAVQIAKAMGAHVTGVCSSRSVRDGAGAGRRRRHRLHRRGLRERRADLRPDPRQRGQSPLLGAPASART